MSNLKYRILVIVALVAASLWALFPRTVVERVNRNGEFVYDTVQRVPLKRGLDLQGGMHLALEIDQSGGTVADRSDAIDQAIRVVRNRIDEFGVAEPVVQKVGNDRIIVELPGIEDAARAASVVQQAAFLEFQITDKTGAFEKAIPRLDQIVRERKLLASAGVRTDTGAATPVDRGLDIFKTRPDTAAAAPGAAGATPAAGDTAATDSAVTPPAAADQGPFARSVQQGQLPGQFFVAQTDVPTLRTLIEQPAIQEALPPGKVLRWSGDSVVVGGQTYRELYLLDARPIITGEYITDARPNQSPQEGTVVAFTLTAEGGRRFRTETGRHVQDYMAIVLDQRVITAPVIQSAIGRRGQITLGNRNLQEAQDLALVLRAGALQHPLTIVESRSIGPSLGQDSINKGITAAGVAVLLVIVVMLVYYRFAGILAVCGLVLYVLYTLATLAGFNAVLTLPGLAGFVLSIGIAVDANVLIFERIREELDHGKTVRTAIDEGFRHAMSAIVDSNVSTALTAAILYQYGTGPVRGFAVTLLAGIAASMVTSIFIVKTFFLVWLNRSRGTAQSLSI